MARAQCLAYLYPKRHQEAEEDTEKALHQSGDDPNVLQGAALVYVVVGNRDRALEIIDKALKKGVQPRWFKLPAFAKLQKDPDFQRIVNTALGATPSR